MHCCTMQGFSFFFEAFRCLEARNSIEMYKNSCLSKFLPAEEGAYLEGAKWLKNDVFASLRSLIDLEKARCHFCAVRRYTRNADEKYMPVMRKAMFRHLKKSVLT